MSTEASIETGEALASAQGIYRFHAQGQEDRAVLKSVELAIHAGEFLCVMGPSGSGKSTLLHVLSGLDRPNAGRVTLAGESLDALPERARTQLRRRTIGYVFQFFNLMPNLSVIENVRLPLLIQGRRPADDQEKVMGLLARLGLEGREAALPHELSGGEMQRVSIARALAGEQPLLLCDEPTGNLSQKAGREVMEILRRVCDEDRRAVLLVTHNPRDASFADRVRFLVDGELVPDLELTGPDIPVDRIHESLAALAI